MSHPSYAGRRVFSAGINLTRLYHGEVTFLGFLLRRETGYIAKFLRGLVTQDTEAGGFGSFGAEDFGWPQGDKPWVGAVDTFAIGGGMQILPVLDRIVAADDAWFSLPALEEGLVPGVANLRLTQLMGSRLSRRIIFWGHRLRADQPEAALLCDETVPADAMDEAVLKAARHLDNPAVGANRRMLTLGEEPFDVFRRYMARLRARAVPAALQPGPHRQPGAHLDQPQPRPAPGRPLMTLLAPPEAPALPDTSAEEPPAALQLAMYRALVRGRAFNQQASAFSKQGWLAVYPSSRGQEACQAGSALAVSPTDWVFPTYRESVALLTRGLDPVEILTLFRGDRHCGYDPPGHPHRTAVHPAGHPVPARRRAGRRGPDVRRPHRGPGLHRRRRHQRGRLPRGGQLRSRPPGPPWCSSSRTTSTPSACRWPSRPPPAPWPTRPSATAYPACASTATTSSPSTGPSPKRPTGPAPGTARP
ncbi:hypothetical protein GCM10020000_76410 [Streptomyces olivoverticillatus]